MNYPMVFYLIGNLLKVEAGLMVLPLLVAVFYGDLKAGCYFVEFAYLFFDASAHAGFVKNRTLMRVIEGYDVIQADAAAYCYGLLDPAAANAPTVDVSVKGTVTTKAEAAG